MTRPILTAAALLGMIISGSEPATAQAAIVAGTPVPTLSVSVEGKVERAPDVADLSGGVVSVAPTAAAAMADNARSMTAVIAAVRRAGIADRDIQTAGISLQPQYRYQNDHPPVLTGYQATNTVSLSVRKLADAGRLLDALVAAGANQISGPNFRVDAADAALDAARTVAVATARKRAELYAQAAGVHLKRLLSLSESGGEAAHPVMMRAKVMSAAAPETPVVPGEVTLAVTVNMAFEIE